MLFSCLTNVRQFGKTQGKVPARTPVFGNRTEATEAATVVGPTPSAGPGTRIGRYRLLEQIGEGGFGTIWMAEQEEPVRRRVALKIVKLGISGLEDYIKAAGAKIGQ